MYELLILPHSGSILDSQLCLKSGKFQLGRWSHEVAILCSWDQPPTHPPPHQLEIPLGGSEKLNIRFFQCCAVSPPKLFPPSTMYRDQEKVRAEKSSNCRKSRTFFLSNFFPTNLFWFIWKQRCMNGRPLILKLVPNDEELNDKIA